MTQLTRDQAVKIKKDARQFVENDDMMAAIAITVRNLDSMNISEDRFLLIITLGQAENWLQFIIYLRQFAFWPDEDKA